MLQISNAVSIPEYEIEMSAVRSQGAGGQNFNNWDLAPTADTPFGCGYTNQNLRILTVE